MTPSLMPRKKLDFFNETLNQFMKNFSITYKCIPGVRRVGGSTKKCLPGRKEGPRYKCILGGQRVGGLTNKCLPGGKRLGGLACKCIPDCRRLGGLA